MRLSHRSRRLASRVGSASIAILAALTALAFARPSTRFSSKPFARLADRTLRAASSADAFGRSGGVKLRLTLPGDSVEFPFGL
ncbi:MAG TPA: hypothetical protein VEA99_06465, partial [Gemmatimonadaceae bacterium]|nr:hypothetical protein [Gemmatimonadaceae bacterium]